MKISSMLLYLGIVLFMISVYYHLNLLLKFSLIFVFVILFFLRILNIDKKLKTQNIIACGLALIFLMIAMFTKIHPFIVLISGGFIIYCYYQMFWRIKCDLCDNIFKHNELVKVEQNKLIKKITWKVEPKKVKNVEFREYPYFYHICKNCEAKLK